jgi:hypothetical protein
LPAAGKVEFEGLDEFEGEWFAGEEPAVELERAEELRPELPLEEVEFEGLLAGQVDFEEELLVGTEVELEESDAAGDTEEGFVAGAETTGFDGLGAEATRALEEVLAGGGVEYT